MEPGSVVRCRNREWVLLPYEDETVYALRPLVGLSEEMVLVHKGLANLIGYDLRSERVEPASFPLPEAREVRDAESARLLWLAARLTLREAAAPLRSLGRISVRPRSYQFVPLLMALRLNTVRLFIADDVGVGKTIEALLVARELLDQRKIRRFAVLCPPYLCDQWAREIQEKFNLEAVVIRSGTISWIDRQKPPERSIYEYFPIQVISIDYIKTERNRYQFLQFCPELVIVDEAHGCARSTQAVQQERYALLRDIAKEPERNLILLTATPHSGIEEAFRSLLGLLRPEFEAWDLQSLSQGQRRELAKHFVQRTRRDIEGSWERVSCFPQREAQDVSYTLSEPYRQLFEKTYRFCSEIVRSSRDLGKWQRQVRYWGALALLRSVMSSPAAALAALANRAAVSEVEGSDSKDQKVAAEMLDQGESTVQTAEDHIPIWAAHVFEPTEDQVDDEVPMSPIQEAAKILAEPERRTLRGVVELAKRLRGTPEDTKLEKAISLAQKLLRERFHPIFWCRYVATAEYLAAHLKARLGSEVQVVCITGRMGDEERKLRIDEMSDEAPRVLVATDCLSEGVNLQEKFTAVVHYDLPWNPNRLEQREGRVDRYGQQARQVKALRFFGQDNPVDGVVIEVLLNKARRIHQTLGVYVPVPEESESVTQAVLEALFLRGGAMRGRQLELDLEVERVKHLHADWDQKADRERKSRALFAQEALKPSEVEREIEAVDAVLGNPAEVQRFILELAHRLGIPIQPDHQRRKAYRISLAREATGHLPEPVQFALSARSRQRPDESWVISFESPTPEGAEYVGRNHPFVAELARYLLEEALTQPEKAVAARCGVLRTDQVKALTILFLLRVRYFMQQRDHPALLAEEVLVLGLREEGEGVVLSPEEALQLFSQARPGANMPLSEKQELAEWVLQRLSPWNDERAWDKNSDSGANGVLQKLGSQIQVRAQALLEAHQRIQQATGQTPRYLRIKPLIPPDLLGILVLQPKVSV